MTEKTENWTALKNLIEAADDKSEPSLEATSLRRAQIIGIYDIVSPFERETISELFVNLLCSKFSAEYKIGLSHSCALMLQLVDPLALERRHCRNRARTTVATEFQQIQTAKNADAIVAAEALLNLGPLESLAFDNWKSFFERFGGIDGADWHVYNIFLSVCLEKGLASFGTAIINRVKIEPDSAKALTAITCRLPSIIERHRHNSELSEFLRKLLNIFDFQEAEMLREAVYALDYEILENPIEQTELGSNVVSLHKRPLIRNTEMSMAMAEKTIERLKGNGIAKTIQSGDICVLFSNYMQSDTIRSAQDRIYSIICKQNELESYAGSRVFVDDSGSFDALSPTRTPTARFAFAFPTYLTENKRQKGYMVAPYGAHRKILAIAPGTNNFMRNVFCEVESIELETIMKAAGETKQKIYCHANYAIHEIIDQQLIESPEIARIFDSNLIQLREPSNPSGSAFDLVREIFKLNTSNLNDSQKWLILLDLGDLQQITDGMRTCSRKSSKWFEALSNRIQCEVEHELDVPVGIGFHPFMACWCSDPIRDQSMISLARELIKDPEFKSELRRIGVVPYEAGDESIGPSKRIEKVS